MYASKPSSRPTRHLEAEATIVSSVWFMGHQPQADRRSAQATAGGRGLPQLHACEKVRGHDRGEGRELCVCVFVRIGG